MRLLIILLFLLCAASAVSADSFSTLGPREDIVVDEDVQGECVGTRIYNHDYSFESAYCWEVEGCAPPYYGAWGEAFDVGPATVECGLFWLTNAGIIDSKPLDLYVWSGGINGPPSEVLLVVPENIGLHIGYWPTCTLNELEAGCCVDADFTVGCWIDWDNEHCYEYVCVDENGPGGRPWTYIAPGIGYPSGWQHPNVVFPNCVSMGIGATITWGPSPVGSRSWGEVKDLFR